MEEKKKDFTKITKKIGKLVARGGELKLHSPKDDKFFEEGHMIDDADLRDGYVPQTQELTINKSEQIISEFSQKK